MNSRAHIGIALVLLAGCGGDEPARAPAPAASPRPPVQPPQPPQLPRSEHDAVRNATLALEQGDLLEANRAVLEIPDGAAQERALLRARLRAREGDAVGAVRAIEEARARWPDQGRVYGAAAEIHAAAGRLESAQDEIRRGLEAAGPTPALTRARGVLSLVSPGGAELGLEHLLAALAADPGLPFCARPLGQAHVLLGRKAMAAERPLEALGHARAARIAFAGEREALELEAEAHEALGEFGAAIEVFEELLAAGAKVGSTLAITCQRGATAALVAGDRGAALERALRARALGLSDDELGFGATLIEQEAEAALDEGVRHFAAHDLAAARDAFERAVRCAPDSLEARNHLAVTLHGSGDAAGAVRHWRRVVEIAAREDLELPEPVHVRLAQALREDGRADEARDVLRRYLAAHPRGSWAAEVAAALEE